MGPKWARMASYFDKRSNIDLKNRYSTLVRRTQVKYNQDSPIHMINYNQTSNVEQILNPVCYINQNQLYNYNFPQTESQLFKIVEPQAIVTSFPNQRIIQII